MEENTTSFSFHDPNFFSDTNKLEEEVKTVDETPPTNHKDDSVDETPATNYREDSVDYTEKYR